MEEKKEIKEIKEIEIKETNLKNFTIKVLKHVNNDYSKIIIYLLENNKIDDIYEIEQDIFTNPNLSIDILFILAKKWFPNDLINSLGYYLNLNHSITVKDIEKHPEISWNFSLLSSNPNITWDFIKSHPNRLLNQDDIWEISKYFKQVVDRKYSDVIDLHWNIVKPDIIELIKLYNTGKEPTFRLNLYQIFTKFIDSMYKTLSITGIKHKWNLIRNGIESLINQNSWDYITISRYNPHITPKIVLENDELLSFSGLNPNITLEIMKKYDLSDLKWSDLARNPNFKYNDLINHFDNKVDFIKNFCYNPNISELIHNLDDWIDIDWNDDEEKLTVWEQITINPGISISNISNNPHLPWAIELICKNPNMTYKTFINNINKIFFNIEDILQNQLQFNKYAKYRNDVDMDKFYMIINFLYNYI